MRRATVGCQVIGTTPTPIVGACANRVAIRFSLGTGSAVTVSDSTTPVATFGIPILANGISYELTREVHGDLVTKAFYGIVGTGTGNVCVVEVIEDGNAK